MTTAMTIHSDLKLPARRVATKAIENVHLAYYEKGGIRDIAVELTTKLETASRYVFSIAQYAAKHADSLTEATKMFVDMCEFAEESYKHTHEVENLREALPTWATYKSNILRGMRAELNPAEYKTEKIFRSATMAQISRTRTHEDETEGHEDRAGPHLLKEPELVDLVSTTLIPDVLKQLVAQVVFAAQVINIRRIEQAEEILRETWQKLGALTDKRKLK